jgi:hypothetical protein
MSINIVMKMNPIAADFLFADIVFFIFWGVPFVVPPQVGLSLQSFVASAPAGSIA